MGSAKIIGTVLILLGFVFVLFPTLSPQHAKIYVSITRNSVTIIKLEIEQVLPLQVVDEYTRNLTKGDRTLEMIAFVGRDTILQESFPNIGVGFTLIRTRSFNRFVLQGETVETTLELKDNMGAIDRKAAQIKAPMPIAYLVGAILILAGIGGFFVPSSRQERHSASGNARRKKRSAR